MDSSNLNWCNGLAGIVTPDLVWNLEKAANLADRHGDEGLASELRSWVSKLTRALNLREAGAEPAEQSEMWLG